MQEHIKKEKEYLCKLLGQKIKQLRENEKKSISLISNEIGLSKSIWADLEKGIKDAQFTTIWRIAEALDIPLSEIILNIENKLPQDWNFIEKI